MPTTATYPANWYEFSQQIRFQRAGRQCECEGECGLHRTHPGPRRCIEIHGAIGQFTAGRIVLTTAHLCTCEPLCAIAEHVKAMCQRCHLRIDAELHAKHAATTRRVKKEKAGQQNFWRQGG